MAKAFSLASWNVEHFKNDKTRIKRVISFLREQDPDRNPKVFSPNKHSLMCINAA